MLRHDTPSHKSVLAICGGGNGPHALAVLASQTFDGDITWHVSSEEKAELLRSGVFSSEGLRSTGVFVAHAPILKQINPYLKDDVLIGTLPTRGGFEFEATQMVSGIEPNPVADAAKSRH